MIKLEAAKRLAAKTKPSTVTATVNRAQVIKDLKAVGFNVFGHEEDTLTFNEVPESKLNSFCAKLEKLGYKPYEVQERYDTGQMAYTTPDGKGQISIDPEGYVHL